MLKTEGMLFQRFKMTKNRLWSLFEATRRNYSENRKGVRINSTRLYSPVGRGGGLAGQLCTDA